MKKFYIIGNPVKHSLSPKIFNKIFKQLEINASYLSKEFSNKNLLVDFINNRDEDLVGFNITLPFKELIYDYIDNIHTSAELVQSINCIKINNSKLFGYNTDNFGFKKLIDINKINFSNSNILVLGNGGSARTILHHLTENYNNDIFVWGRNNKKVDDLILNINSTYNTNQIKQYKSNDKKSWVVVNCISFNIDKKSINNILSVLPSSNVDLIIDINYLKTPFNDALKLKTSKMILGEDMLIFQALKTFDIWFDNKYSNLISYKKIKEIF